MGNFPYTPQRKQIKEIFKWQVKKQSSQGLLLILEAHFHVIINITKII